MTAHGGTIYPVGAQYVIAYLLDEHGVPKATGASGAVYEGIQLEAATSFDLDIPDARRVTFLGDNVVKGTMLLPRQDPTKGTLKIARVDHAAFAMISGTKRAVVGEASMIGYGTDTQGEEPAIGLLCVQPGIEGGSGASCYHAYNITSTRAIIKPGSMNNDAISIQYDLTPNMVNHPLWGVKYTAGTNGFTEAEITDLVTYGRPMVVSWLGDNVVTKFAFPTDKQPASTSKIHAIATIAADGTVTDDTSGATKALDGVTPSTKPAAGVMVLCFYEY